MLEHLAWRATRWYLRRRFGRAARQLAIAGAAGGAVFAAALAAQRRAGGG